MMEIVCQSELLDQAQIDASWRPLLETALSKMNPDYLHDLVQEPHWLPGPANIFNAFQLPLENTNVILMGESPYPREASANGFAFWDAAVGPLWSETGLSKPVNRATSLRNIIKMLLVADGKLDAQDTSQPAIANLDKSSMIQTNDELFENLLAKGFLLLNASPVLSQRKVQHEAKFWLPFLQDLLPTLIAKRPQITLLLFGKIANIICDIPELPACDMLCAEHPYNISFIHHPDVLAFFRPLKLLGHVAETVAQQAVWKKRKTI